MFKKLLQQKWFILKVVWNTAVMVLLIWLSVLLNQNTNLLNFGFGMVTENQGVINNNILQHQETSCKKINI